MVSLNIIYLEDKNVYAFETYGTKIKKNIIIIPSQWLTTDTNSIKIINEITWFMRYKIPYITCIKWSKDT